MAIASRLLVTMTMMTMMTSPAISLDWVGEGIVIIIIILIVIAAADDDVHVARCSPGLGW